MYTLRHWGGLVFGLMALVSTAESQVLQPADDAKAPSPRPIVAQQPGAGQPSTPATPAQPGNQGAPAGSGQSGGQGAPRDVAGSSTDSSSNAAGDVAPAGDIPNMMGDFPGRSGFRIFFVPRFTQVRDVQTTIVFLNPNEPPITRTTVREFVVQTNEPVAVRVPIASRTYKVAENESPMPRDRVYFQFNYFDDLYGSINRRFANVGTFNQHREGVGFEKSFLNGAASFGMRVPVSTIWNTSTVPGIGGTDPELGDVTLIFKTAPYFDPRNLDVLSLGLAVTLPTAQGAPAPFNSTAFQPFVGFIWTFGDLYLQGFTSVDIPTDDNDVTLLFNDVGVGYIVYRSLNPDSLVTIVAPTIEVHVNTPLNHRGAFDLLDPAGTPDWVSITAGTTFQLFGRSTLAIGGNVPVTGPKPYDFEIQCQLNWYY